MSFPGIRRGLASTVRVLPGPLLVLLSLLTVVWFAPEVPYPAQDSAWVLALNQAVADHLAFGRDVLFTLGPWGTVYAGQYHPATDGMMLAGGAIVALALAGGLWALARGGRRSGRCSSLGGATCVGCRSAPTTRCARSAPPNGPTG